MIIDDRNNFMSSGEQWLLRDCEEMKLLIIIKNKGKIWKYGQVFTKIQNKIVSLQQICDDFG